MPYLLQSISKWIAIASLLILLTSLLYKDRLPDPDYFLGDQLEDPVQTPTQQAPFWVEAGGQRYRLTPLFDYTLEGVVVSYHNADAFSDIWHHDKWQDYINLRDLCVIWGGNVSSGVYQDMSFKNDSWTCWAYWPDAETAARFDKTQLSNNHLLVDDESIKRILMSAQPGDQIRVRGMLASYENPANGFKRGTSTRRDDTGNGACETLYVTSFDIVNEANTRWRTFNTLAKWTLGLSTALFLVLFFITPGRRNPNL